MNIRTVDPTLLRIISTYPDEHGIFSLTNQTGGGRVLWCRKVYGGNADGISPEDRWMLVNLKVPQDTPMIVRRKASVNAVYWVCWDKTALLRILEQQPARRESAP